MTRNPYADEIQRNEERIGVRFFRFVLELANVAMKNKNFEKINNKTNILKLKKNKQTYQIVLNQINFNTNNKKQTSHKFRVKFHTMERMAATYFRHVLISMVKI